MHEDRAAAVRPRRSRSAAVATAALGFAVAGLGPGRPAAAAGTSPQTANAIGPAFAAFSSIVSSAKDFDIGVDVRIDAAGVTSDRRWQIRSKEPQLVHCRLRTDFDPPSREALEEVVWRGGTAVQAGMIRIDPVVVLRRDNPRLSDPLGERCDEYRLAAIRDLFLSGGHVTETPAAANAKQTIETLVPADPAVAHGFTRATLALDDSTHLPAEFVGYVGEKPAADFLFWSIHTDTGMTDADLRLGAQRPYDGLFAFADRAGYFETATGRVSLSTPLAGGSRLDADLTITDSADKSGTCRVVEDRSHRRPSLAGTTATFPTPLRGRDRFGTLPASVGNACGAFGIGGLLARIATGPHEQRPGPKIDGTPTVAETFSTRVYEPYHALSTVEIDIDAKTGLPLEYAGFDGNRKIFDATYRDIRIERQPSFGGSYPPTTSYEAPRRRRSVARRDPHPRSSAPA